MVDNEKHVVAYVGDDTVIDDPVILHPVDAPRNIRVLAAKLCTGDPTAKDMMTPKAQRYLSDKCVILPESVFIWT